MNGKRSTRVPDSRQNRSKPTRRSWKVIAIALYITFLMLSTIPFLADRTIDSEMKETYEYHLRYPRDGRQTHYYVERLNTSHEGQIDIVYTTATNALIVDTKNIKVLHIFCRSMYEDECRKVFGFDPNDNSNYYKWYFIEKDHLTVTINADHEIRELKFIDTPKPYEVIVNGEIWQDGTDYFFTDTSGIALSNVPAEDTIVDIYFKPMLGTPPNAVLSASRTLVAVNQTVEFDGSKSFDTDGTISTHLFDFGDATFRSGSDQVYKYSKPGTYGVILMVRDNDDLVDHAYVNITVVESSDIPEIHGCVPDQMKPEDSPPWLLDLGDHEPVADTKGIEFYWYLTGENTSLYTVVGENSTNDKLIFMVEPDLFGSDLVELWLWSTEHLYISQPLWINITPVNDEPIIDQVPDLMIHYDDPYTFDHAPYVYDLETPKDELVLEISCGHDGDFISIDGLKATYTYPQSLVGEIFFATITVTDGNSTSYKVITIQVTSNNVPKLIDELPDVVLFEGETKYNVFDLDDYFQDPDDDSIFFQLGKSHTNITIDEDDNTVDISAYSEWTGIEEVTFRALDPMGALAEDTIEITVLQVNDPPVISGVPNLFVRYDLEYRFDLTLYVHDNDNDLWELTISTSEPVDRIRIDPDNNMIIILNYSKECLNRNFPVYLIVSDGIDICSQRIQVNVTEDYPPTLIDNIPDITFKEDEEMVNAFNIDQYFEDIDGDALYYTTGNTFINITINPDLTVNLHADPDWFGTEDVYFRATDPTGAISEDQVSITVLPVNDRPVILTIPIQEGYENMRWLLDLAPYIIDIDNDLSELEFRLDNEFVVLSGSQLIFLGSPDLPKQITLTVSDGEYNVSQTIEVKVILNKGPDIPTLWDLIMEIFAFLIIIIVMILVVVLLVHRKMTRFSVEEVFLIHKSGTLINHLRRESKANVGDVIISGMFTVVQEFIRDSFAKDGSEEEKDWILDELKLGEKKILIERRENVYLALIFSGKGSKRLRRIASSLLNEIEKKYASILPTWDGNIRQLVGTKEILSVLIDTKVKPPVDNPSPAIPSSQPETRLRSPLVHKPQTPVITVESKMLAIAQPIQKQNSKPISVEPLSSTGKQSGVYQPGLSSRPMASPSIRGENMRHEAINKEKLPTAMQISSNSQQPKPIVISKDQLPVKNKPVPIVIKTPHCLDGTYAAKPVEINMSGSNKPFLIDPNKSLLKQLVEMDNNDEPN